MARSLCTSNGSDENIELLLHAVISVNQYGAAADLRNELSEDFGASEKPEAPDHLETMEIHLMPTNSRKETCCKTMSANSNNCPETRNDPNYALVRV